MIVMASSENELPNYDQCVSPAPPPTYRSLYGRIRSWTSRVASGDVNPQHSPPMRQLSENEGSWDHQRLEEVDGEISKELVILFLFSLAMTVVSVVGIVIGILNIGHCPVEPFVPVWTIIYGMGIISCLLFGPYPILYQQISGVTFYRPKLILATKVIATFLLLWLIFGNILVYKYVRAYSFTEEFTLQCNEIMFEFAFWLMTGTYLLLGGAGLIFCCSSLSLWFV